MCAPIPAELFINGLGQRVKKTNVTNVFVYDEGGQLLGEYDSKGAALYETVYLDDQPVAIIKPGSSTAPTKFFMSMPII